MATHSSILAQEIPWTEKSGSLAGYSPWSYKEPDTTEQRSTSNAHGFQHLYILPTLAVFFLIFFEKL